jgi:hypothetical protein
LAPGAVRDITDEPTLTDLVLKANGVKIGRRKRGHGRLAQARLPRALRSNMEEPVHEADFVVDTLLAGETLKPLTGREIAEDHGAVPRSEVSKGKRASLQPKPVLEQFGPGATIRSPLTLLRHVPVGRGKETSPTIERKSHLSGTYVYGHVTHSCT